MVALRLGLLGVGLCDIDLQVDVGRGPALLRGDLGDGLRAGGLPLGVPVDVGLTGRLLLAGLRGSRSGLSGC